MADKVNLEQKIQRFRQANPRLENLTDKQILSVMVENGEITLSEAQKVSIYSNTQSNADNQGLTVQKQTKSRTINLKSGRKIVIKDGTAKYYAADGVELKKEYFEKQEGQIDVKPSGRYSITKAGKTKYYAADGTELKESYFKQVENTDIKVKSVDGKTYNLNKTLENRINKVTVDLEKAEDGNGFIGSAWSGFKNLTGIGDSSDKVRELQETEKKLLQQFNSNEQKRPEIFKELTGAEYTPENLEKFIKGEIKLKSEIALQGYNEGQEMAVDITADIVSGIAAVGIYTAAVAAAPFTGGASIAVGVVAAGASGSVIKTGLKAADAATGGREYTLQDAKHDAATGAFSGIIAPITGGLGGAVGKTVATKLGIQAVKQVGKEAAEEGVNIGVKATLKTALTNPTGYEYVGGNTAKRGLAFAAETATDGAVGGAVDNAFRTAYNGGGVNEVLDAAAEGFVGGAIISPIIGGGMKATGKAGQKVFGKDNVHIDANKKVIHTDVVFDLLNNKVDMDYAAAVFRDIDDLEQAFRVAELDISDKEKGHFYEIKEQLLKKVNKNIADHGSIVLQTDIPAERFITDNNTGVRYAKATQDDIVLAHAVQNNEAVETLTYLVNAAKKHDENNYLSLSLINKNSNLFGDETEGVGIYTEYGIIPNVRNKDVTSAGFGQVSEYKKDFSTFTRHFSLLETPEQYVYLKNSLLNKLKDSGYNLSDNDYIQLFNLLKNKKYFNEITEDININGMLIKADILRDALEESHVELAARFLYGNGSNNEVTAIIDGIKAIYARVDNIEDVKPEVLALAKANSLDIILLGKPTKPEITNPKYVEKLKEIETKFEAKEITMLERMRQKRELKQKYETIEKEKLRARTNLEKNLSVDKKTYLDFLKKDIITNDDIKYLFPSGQFDKENFFMQSILEVIPKIDPTKHIVDFMSPFDTKDYEIIACLFNIHKGKYKKMWLTKAQTDTISNVEKLAIFARIIRSLKKVDLYLKFDEKIWDIIAKGIIEKPKGLIKPLISYKLNSNDINGALSKNVKMTPEIKNMIEEISKYIADSPINNTVTAYRGETSYWIFGKEMTPEGLLIRDEMLKHETSSPETRNAFVSDVLLDIVFEYPRFLSTAFDQKDAEARAIKILWHLELPQNTKGIMIESYNIERESETEFLIQRNSEISIYDVKFDETNKRWEIYATILQRAPLTPLE